MNPTWHIGAYTVELEDEKLTITGDGNTNVSHRYSTDRSAPVVVTMQPYPEIPS